MIISQVSYRTNGPLVYNKNASDPRERLQDDQDSSGDMSPVLF